MELNDLKIKAFDLTQELIYIQRVLDEKKQELEKLLAEINKLEPQE